MVDPIPMIRLYGALSTRVENWGESSARSVMGSFGGAWAWKQMSSSAPKWSRNWTHAHSRPGDPLFLKWDTEDVNITYWRALLPYKILVSIIFVPTKVNCPYNFLRRFVIDCRLFINEIECGRSKQQQRRRYCYFPHTNQTTLLHPYEKQQNSTIKSGNLYFPIYCISNSLITTRWTLLSYLLNPYLKLETTHVRLQHYRWRSLASVTY